MAQCPICSAEVLEDFGSTECESCGAQLIIQIDGSVEAMGQGEGASEPEFREPEREFEAEEPGQNNPGEVYDIAAEQDEAADEPFEEDLPPVPQYEKPDIFADPDSEPTPEPVSDLFSEPDPEPEPQAEMASSPANSADLSDIADFGNSEASSGRDGALRYNLSIRGIDTADVREAFREALTDRRFLWDTDQILRTIRNGEVRISNVAASKAYMLITRLRSLPVRVKWEQYAVHQP